MRNEGNFMRGWCSKYIAHVLRIAGILHLSIDPTGQSPVAGETMQNAITIGLFFREHAHFVYASSTAMTPESKIPVLIAKIRDLGGIEIKRSDLVHSLRIKNFMTVEDIQPALDLMIEHGYIKMNRPESNARGKKPDFVITLRPELR